MSPFDDLAEFVAIPRMEGLQLSPDGTRLVTSVQQLDPAGAKYLRSLWEIDPAGERPARRLTRSAKGEAAPAFLPDGTLLFTSARPDADGEDEKAQLWALPVSGEAEPVAQSPGGCSGPVTARSAGTFVLTTPRMPGADSAEDDERRRTERKDGKIDAMLHDGFPIRYWDHELGPDRPRLLAGAELRDLAPDAGPSLEGSSYALSPDGRTAIVDWKVPAPHGYRHSTLVAIDVESGERRTFAAEDGVDHSGPVISPDGRSVAALRSFDGDFETILSNDVWIHALDGSGSRPLPIGDDLFVTGYAWAPDSATLYAWGDRRGRGAVVAVDVDGGEQRRLVSDAFYSSVCPSPDGRFVYAVRSAMDRPNMPVRLEVSGIDQEPVFLPAPVPELELPGTVQDVSATAADGSTVRGWLFTPADVSEPTDLQLWIHGGPFASYNSWSWRWCPWLAVERGWSVLLPDPALSTGYGPDWFARAWPHRAAEVWADCEVLLDAVCERPEINADRVAALGASFGGYMMNWLAGHTDRFAAIVTHSGLWAADQQHTTTDASDWKTGLFGRPEEHPEWYAENSPHHFIERITTPILITHGNRDYRVPYSESLRFWWDLVNYFAGDPAELPHRFLQLPGENHWVLSPGNARVWNETVIAFLNWHVRGEKWQRPELV
ncbi:MAG TPA: prolyl oligopeptidase family serine peptidase [Mycobacteriales bacterium]|nr:prolyl oligopeptidase family serine peptidase [Mycobacteriales bacterium]